jgi:hypothetical protein
MTVPGISITLPAIALQLIGIIPELVIGISPES